MKESSLPFTLSLAVLMATAMPAQDVVFTPIVGFDTIQVAGSTGTTAQLNFAATELLSSVKYVGSASSITANTVTDSLATWAENQFNGTNGSHYLEILSVNGSTTAAGVGTTISITGSSAASKTLALASNLPASVTAPMGYRVVCHWTIGSLFGAANTAGLQGGSSINADQIQLWAGNSHESYYYQTAGIGGTGWRRVGSQSADASGTPIRPDQSLIIKRGQNAPVSITVIGEVKTGRTSFTVNPGFNFVPNPYSVAMTLSSCGIYTGSGTSGLAGGNITNADQVLVWNGSSYDTYYYQTSGIGGSGWRKVGDLSSDAGSAVIRAASSVIVRRTNPASFTWAMPQHPASF